MSEERKKSGAGAWTAGILGGLILLTVLYGLSLGPLVWILAQSEPTSPLWLETAFEYYCFPASIVYAVSPERVQHAMDAYIGFFIADP